MEVGIISSSHVPSIVFQIFSKGLLRTSQVIKLENGTVNFIMTPKFAHSPEAHFMAFFIDDDGEIVSDSIILHLENVLPNSVSVEMKTHLV